MSGSEVTEFVGYLLGSFGAGWIGGYLIQAVRRTLEHV